MMQEKDSEIKTLRVELKHLNEAQASQTGAQAPVEAAVVREESDPMADLLHSARIQAQRDDEMT